jgi:pyruvate dehydrogenase E2 component (dihydrolipoamide acetyltransferase)
MKEAKAFLEGYPSETPVTLTHYVAIIIAHCLGKYSELNHVLRGGKLYERLQTDVFISTLLRTAKGKDLSGFVVRDVTCKGLAEVAAECGAGATKLRHGEDREMARVQRLVEKMPNWLLRMMLNIQEFFQYTLNMSLGLFGLPKDRFGSVMVTNIGALGIDNALIPLSPYSRCAMIIGVGKPREAPVVENGDVVAGTCVTISFTFDHRYADGAHGAHVLRRFEKVFLNPHKYSSLFANKGDGGEGKEIVAY